MNQRIIPRDQDISHIQIHPSKFQALIHLEDINLSRLAEYLYGGKDKSESGARSQLSKRKTGRVKPTTRDIIQTIEWFVSLRDDINMVLNHRIPDDLLQEFELYKLSERQRRKEILKLSRANEGFPLHPIRGRTTPRR
jgi:hypothetical protein